MFICIEELLHIWQKNPRERRLIGIDWGEKRIGIAVSDRSGIIASPLTTVLFKQMKKERRVIASQNGQVVRAAKSKEQLFNETVQDVAAVVEREHPIAISFGVPLNMNGSCGVQYDKALAFAEALSEVVTPAIFLADERLSSAAVEKAMIQADLTRAKRAKCIDRTSAAYVLQGVVDQLNFMLVPAGRRPNLIAHDDDQAHQP
ncbi:MAG: Holliday junction resolvase RuvX [Holosporales bacterium]|jgi:putative Holliday junction resolvase|nr:Holliday junction resolvase RuvX [Holosporales bacterium]